MHTFDSCRSFGSPSSFSILCVSMHVKEQFSSRIKNNAQNRAKKKVKAQIWKAKKTQLNDAQCTSFFLVRFISATQFSSPFPAIITDWSQMPGSLVCPFFIFRCFRPEWSSICIVDIFFLLFGLVWFASQKSVCVCVCFFGRPHFEMEFAEIEQVHSQCSNCRQKRKRMSFGVNPLLIQIKMDTRMK